MTIGEWATIVGLFVGLATAWATILVKLATMSTRLKLIEENHLPTLAKQLKALPCQEHSEEEVKLTIRLEAVTERLEKLEKKLNNK